MKFILLNYFLLLVLNLNLFSSDIKEVKSLKKVTLQLKWKNSFQFAGYYIAKEKGYYKEIGIDLDIKEFEDGINIADVVQKNENTYGIGGISIILEEAQNKNIILLAAIFQSSPLILLTNKNSKINTIKDFKNKKIMLGSDPLNNIVLNAMLQSEDLSLEDMIIQKQSFNIKDLITNKTDLITAYISDQPYQLSHLGYKSTIFHPKDYGFDFYNDILFTSKKELEKDPQTVRDFKIASLRAWEYAFNNFEETIEIILKHYNTQNYSKEALLYQAKELKKLAYYKTDEIGKIEKEKIVKIMSLYHIIQHKETDYALTFQIIIFFCIVGALFLYRFRIINNYTNKIKEYLQIINNHVLISTSDINGNITEVSSALCELSGYKKEELIGQNHSIFKHKDMKKEVYDNLWKTIINKQTWKGEVKNLNKDGSYYWAEVIISPILDKNYNIKGFSSIRNNITDKINLEKLAQTDNLTKLYNRLYLDNNYEREIQRANRYKNDLSIILIDIDFFKKVNDTYGHEKGDIVLIQISNILTKNIRETDILGRWGGEEFLIICPETNLKNAKNLACKIRKVIEKYNFLIKENITCSFGLAQYKKTNIKDDTFKRADVNLFKAKETGRNKVIS